MIEIFEGRVGGGKTYSAVYRIILHLVRGLTVCTNIELVWDEVKKLVRERFGLILQDDQLIKLADHQICKFHEHTPNGAEGEPVLIVIDEVHLNFNNRDFAKSDANYRDTFSYLTQSRKTYNDIIFISQSQFNIDKQFARQIQYLWRFRDMGKWKIPGLGIGSPFKGILACQFDYDGKTLLEKEFVHKDKGIFKCYKTNALLRSFPRLAGAVVGRKLERVAKKYPRSTPWLVLASIALWLVNLVMYLNL